MSFLAGQTLTAAALNLATKKILARGRRTTASTGTTTEVGVIRLDDIPIVGGRLYEISSSTVTPDTGTNGDMTNVRIRYTTDGSTPSTSSTVLPGAIGQVRLDDASNGEALVVKTFYAPASDETLSLLLTVGRSSGSGTITLFADGVFETHLVVKDVGVDPGDTGTDI